MYSYSDTKTQHFLNQSRICDPGCSLIPGLIWPEAIDGGVRAEDRSPESSLFPASLDDFVREDNPLRAVDVFVKGLDF